MASDENNDFNSDLNTEVPHFDLNELPGLEIDEFDGLEEVKEAEHDNTDVIDLQLDREANRGVQLIPDLNEEPNVENQNSDEGHEQRRCKVLSNGERQMIYHALLKGSVHSKLKRNTCKEVASRSGVALQTVQRIWKRSKATPTGTTVDLSDRRPKNSGKKRIEVELTRISAIPWNRRTTIRSLANALNVNKDTLHRRFKEGLFRRHSNAVKPYLKEEHKIARLKFCLSILEASSLPHDPRFVDMYNVVHIDEKWFYMKKRSKTVYMLHEEDNSLRSCQSKNFIEKVMFLVAVARPRFDNKGNETFSGKIGLFLLVTKQPAQRRSRNREAGTLETKPITHVTKEIIRAFLVENIIPAIQAKWPRGDSGRTIFIQQDNARTHVSPNDEQFCTAASQNGFDIQLRCQPANSPDLNVLDLGFFNAIQSLQDKECAKTINELILAVEKSYEEYPATKINHVFLSLQSCMKEIMRVEGSNRYEIPHMYKAGLERTGNLPIQLTCDQVLVQNVINILENRRE